MSEQQEGNEDFLNCLDGMIGSPERSINKEQLIEIWSKVQIAEIMQRQAKQLLDKAQTDLEFYKLIAAQQELDG